MSPIVRAFILSIALTASATAHPVAQGAMDILVAPESVTIHARVANEQIFVAETLGKAQPPAENLDEAWVRHGDYLIEHLRVFADEQLLIGRVVNVVPPATPAADGRTTYEFAFDIPPEKVRPRHVVFRQDVLNEFEFVPGNRWEATYLVRLAQKGGPVHEGLLFTSKQALGVDCDWSAPGAASSTPQLSKGRLFREYLHHGVMHILTGYDHLLFMAALVLAAVTLLDLVKVVTAFTAAHTLTLTLSVLDLVRLPSSIVEPIIAGSIVVVALQNIFAPERSRGATRLLLAFAFGLFHGLGFAGGLLEAMEGLPHVALALAIIAFSIGVELGHSAVVAPLFLALRCGDALVRNRERPRRWVLRFGSSAICCAGLFYFVSAIRASA